MNKNCPTLSKAREKSVPFPKKRTGTHPFISYGNFKIKLLECVFNKKNKVFCVKEFARKFNNSNRSRVYRAIKSLLNDGYIERQNYGDLLITNKGIDFLDQNKGVPLSRRGCPTKKKNQYSISAHHSRFSMPLCKKPQKSVSFLKDRLNPIKYKAVNLRNWTQYIFYFEFVTVRLNRNNLVFQVEDTLGDNTEEAQISLLEKVLPFVELFESVGFVGDELFLDSVHYAKINSWLAQSLEKLDNKYFLELSNGKKIWIDRSPLDDIKENIEDETDSADVRERWDEFFNDTLESKSLMSDVDKMKDVLGTLIKFEVIKQKNNFGKGQDAVKDLCGLRDYTI